VGLDRAATLRNAEKLLRQGKLDAAIGEYVRLVEESPRDFNTANILGDLYVRAGQLDKAVETFARIADSLSDEGFLPKAGALYKKILKIKPDHEHALLRGAEIAGSQGLLVDARSYLNTLLARRRSRGDQRGVAQIRIRLAMLDPADYAARFAAARARIEVGDAADALRDFKELARELIENARQEEALDALREAAVLSPDDQEIRAQLLQVYLSRGEFAKARESASTSAELKGIAAQLEAIGQGEEALATLREAARLDSSDAGLQEHLARVFVERGDLAAAAEYLTTDTVGDNPQLLLTVAEIRLRSGRVDEGLDIARRVLAQDPVRRPDIARVGWTVAEQAPEAAFRVVGLAADSAVADGDWPSAAAAFQELVTRVPSHIPALMRLVEICVDGGLEATMYSAQAQLADAYIAIGSAAEARFIAEDLVAREPWDRANIERFRRALVLLGEADPDALIAERLSGQTPFMSTDLSLHGDELPSLESAAQLLPPLEMPAEPAAEAVEILAEPDSGAAASALSRVIELELADPDSDFQVVVDTPVADATSDAVDVDLSLAVDDDETSAGQPAPPDPPPATGEPRAADLDGVFSQLREEATRRSRQSGAEEDFRRGVAALDAGQFDEAAPLLQSASKSPRLRFAAASRLGRAFREHGMTHDAVEWLERAAEAPPPNPEEGHLLLYELAEALEATGELARALAICIELQAEAGDYRDIAARVERLAKVQTRG
jgi:tetratricopeptide (TPR) repeat protein